MRSRIGFIEKRIAVNLAESGTPLIVFWANTTGGTTDAGTGAAVGGTTQNLSGVLNVFGVTELPQTVVRTFQEVQAGDLIVDLAPDPVVSLFPGQPQSGVLPLAQLDTPKFDWMGVWYEQQKIGQGLVSAWDAVLAGHRLHSTILLRRAV